MNVVLVDAQEQAREDGRESLALRRQYVEARQRARRVVREAGRTVPPRLRGHLAQRLFLRYIGVPDVTIPRRARAEGGPSGLPKLTETEGPKSPFYHPAPWGDRRKGAA